MAKRDDNLLDLLSQCPSWVSVVLPVSCMPCFDSSFQPSSLRIGYCEALLRRARRSRFP
jgi:hypothetical protein